jgi:deoxyadenosine/deoxycytidine kinase
MIYEIQIVSIEGNIGSGKSTLLANLKIHFNKNTKILFLREPVDEWNKITDENGVTILEKFYANQEKYSFPFQMMAYISRLKLLKDTINDIRLEVSKISSECAHYEWGHNNCLKFIIITERSLYTDKLVFAKMLYDCSKIEEVNYKIYLSWFDTFSKEFPVHKVIYVKTKPEICHERIHKRSREGEENIPLSYLKSCDEYHEDMLSRDFCDNITTNQLILDGNVDIYDKINSSILQVWLKDVELFINNK